MRNASIALVLAALAGCSSPSSTETAQAETTSGSETQSAEQQSFAQVSVDQVATALAAADGSVAVFDANSRETYDEHHVPTATWVDYDAVTAEQLPSDRSTQLVFYCANEQCEASHVAANTASSLGYTNVTVMGAGIQGWIAAGKPVEAGTAAPAAPAAE